jgi:alpha-tubulin suppressor-like RCC1 family protein
MKISRDRIVTGIMLSAALLVACDPSQDGTGVATPPSTPEETTEVVVELTTVPPAVRCIGIDVQRSPTDPAPVQKRFPVLANASSTNLNIGRLALGFARFNGRAWDVDCADPTINSLVPSWQAQPVETTIMLGATTRLRLNFFQNEPPQVDANFVKNVMEISMGSQESYARFADGTIWQWGALGGNLNNISTVARPFPLANVAKVGVGFNFACALLTNGTVNCWGSSPRGQVGPGVPVGGSTSSPTLVPLPPGMVATDLAVGDSHACIVNALGSIACWGDNTFGQLAVSTVILPAGFTASPIPMGNILISRIFAGGESTCGWNGQLFCWGRNDSGQLGTGGTAHAFSPFALPYRGIVDVAMGRAHTCALHGDGNVGCWGGNGSGQIGDGTTVNKLTEVNVFRANGAATAIATGNNHSCMLSSTSPTTTTDRVLTCWGDNFFGQIGDGTGVNKNTPNPRFAGVIALFAHGSDGTCIERSGGLEVQCTGFNTFGQLGDGTKVTKFLFSPVLF